MPRSLAWMRPKLTNFHETTFAYKGSRLLHATYIYNYTYVRWLCVCARECKNRVNFMYIYGSWAMQIYVLGLRQSHTQNVRRISVRNHTAVTLLPPSIHAKVLSSVCERETNVNVTVSSVPRFLFSVVFVCSLFVTLVFNCIRALVNRLCVPLRNP